MKFSKEDKLLLLHIARESIIQYIDENKSFSPGSSYNYSPMNEMLGAFVSVYHSNKLRGCIGRFQTSKPLYLLIPNIAVTAATSDYRFRAIEKKELESISLELSILTPLKKIHSADEISIGKHGIYIKYKSKIGTLLPQVAVKQGWDRLDFLEYCAKHKVGIAKNDWKKADLFTYETLLIKDMDLIN